VEFVVGHTTIRPARAPENPFVNFQPEPITNLKRDADLPLATDCARRCCRYSYSRFYKEQNALYGPTDVSRMK